MRKTIGFVLLLALLTGLCACGGGDTAVLDGEALCTELLGSAAFSAELEELPSGKAGVFYGVDDEKLLSARMYHGTGISKEQIAVFEAVDEDAAKAMVPVLQELTAEWLEADRDYAPEEAAKLEKLVLRQSGSYVLLVVANDPALAVEIVGHYL